jgi:fumarate hydratase class I
MQDAFLELIRRASVELPKDVIDAIESYRTKEAAGSMARNILGKMLESIVLSRELSVPLCQDTGTLIFYIDYPAGMRSAEKKITDAIKKATVAATKKQYLRPNSVDPRTEKNTGNNLGIGHPSLHFHQWDKPHLRARLLLKGGGCENVGIQYKLPDKGLGAGRDFEGVRRCIIDAAVQAQGRGCAPGVLGVCIGGDRGYGYVASKEQFFRKLDDVNPDKTLAALEARCLDEINRLGIGPMGLGGNTTVFGVKIGTANRLPACYFVTVSYMCWSYRRKQMIIRDKKVRYA